MTFNELNSVEHFIIRQLAGVNLNAQGIVVVDHCLGGNGYRKVSWTVGPTAPLVETVFAEREGKHGH